MVVDTVYLDFLHLVSFAVLGLQFYGMEYRIRYEFYTKKKQVEFQKSYRKFLVNLPNGIVILDNSNNLIFYNQAVANIVRKPNADFVHREGFYDPLNRRRSKLNVTKGQLMQTLEEFINRDEEAPDNMRTLKCILENSKEEDEYKKIKFKYNMNGETFIYEIILIKMPFQSKKCTTIIIQDQSDFEKLRELDEKYRKLYVASIVHDIRTPLNGIMGMLDVLEDELKTKQSKSHLAVARNTGKLLLFLTYDITDFSQLDCNKFVANNSKINIKEVINEVSQLFSFSFERKKLASQFYIDPNTPPIIDIDKNRYMQIILNILGNALKFTNKGRIDVEVIYDRANDILITNVRDTGIGIHSEDISKLFKLFGKLEKGGELNPQGVGFGLAVCKRLTESLGGYIKVVSKVNEGSTFTFGIKANIMMEDPDKQEAEDKLIRLDNGPFQIKFSIAETFISNKVQSTKAIGNKKTCTCNDILIVDDNEYNLFVLSNYLKSVNLTADEVNIK